MPLPSPNDRMPGDLSQLSGTVLEQRYELGRMLGSGGMGAVFEARHLRLDRAVAIKVLWPSLRRDEEYIERFLREAKATSKIQHPNVVEIHDYGEAAGGVVYSVMELLVGQDLDALLESQLQGRLPWVQVSGLLIQIASGLEAAHGHGVIHRDIKPANCFLTDEYEEPVVKLVDFGVAKLEDDDGPSLTGGVKVLGTPSYIAPEMVRQRVPASPRTDIYSLGVLAYRMLTGRVPFKGRSLFELIRRACFEPVPSLCEQVPQIPPEVEAFILELLAKDPGARPADMSEVLGRLTALSQRTSGWQASPRRTRGRQLQSARSGPPPISLGEPILTWDPGSQQAPVSPTLAGATEVVRMSGAVDPLSKTVVEDAPTRSIGIPQMTIDDPYSAPLSPPPASCTGATIPASGPSPLRFSEIPQPPGRLPKKGRLARLLIAIGVLTGLGVLVGWVMLGGEDPASEHAGVEALTSETEPAPDEDDGVEDGATSVLGGRERDPVA